MTEWDEALAWFAEAFEDVGHWDSTGIATANKHLATGDFLAGLRAAEADRDWLAGMLQDWCECPGIREQTLEYCLATDAGDCPKRDDVRASGVECWTQAARSAREGMQT